MADRCAERNGRRGLRRQKGTAAATSGGKLVGSRGPAADGPGRNRGWRSRVRIGLLRYQASEDSTIEFLLNPTRWLAATSSQRSSKRPTRFPAAVEASPWLGGSRRRRRWAARSVLTSSAWTAPVRSLPAAASIGFADQDKLEAGASGTFSVNPIGSCDQFLVSAGGYGF